MFRWNVRKADVRISINVPNLSFALSLSHSLVWFKGPPSQAIFPHGPPHSLLLEPCLRLSSTSSLIPQHEKHIQAFRPVQVSYASPLHTAERSVFDFHGLLCHLLYVKWNLPSLYAFSTSFIPSYNHRTSLVHSKIAKIAEANSFGGLGLYFTGFPIISFCKSTSVVVLSYSSFLYLVPINATYTSLCRPSWSYLQQSHLKVPKHFCAVLFSAHFMETDAQLETDLLLRMLS